MTSLDEMMSDTTFAEATSGEAARYRPAERPARRTATRADLLDGIAATTPHLSRADVRHVFEVTLEEMSDALRRGDLVKLRSFGLFTVRAKRQRVGRNPRTGVEVPISPRRVLTFKPSTVLLDLVNGGNAGGGAGAESSEEPDDRL